MLAVSESGQRAPEMPRPNHRKRDCSATNPQPAFDTARVIYPALEIRRRSCCNQRQNVSYSQVPFLFGATYGPVNKVARRFKSKVDYRGRGEWNLRLITKPIYNYTYQNEDEDKLKQTVSGSVFAFCRSTDPEVLLMLESRTTKAGEKQWYWASVCFAGESSFLSLDGKEVWAEQPRFGSNIKHGSHFKIRTFNYVEALKRKQDIASKQ